jgi:hypothetical protein
VDGTSDPYARAFVGPALTATYTHSDNTQTKFLENDLAPFWDETLSFKGIREAEVLSVQVLDADTFGDGE